MTVVRFQRLAISNFKRYAGEHLIPLDGGKGGLTIIAAQNGVGKTTTLDAFFIALYGKRGFQARYEGVRYEDWLERAYAIDATEYDRSMFFALDLECPINGAVHIERTYWLLNEEDGGISEEFGLTIDGRPLEVEVGERRSDVATRWVEALLPLAAMRRFLVDNERLAELEPRQIEEDVRAGLDDVLGLGAAERLLRHLNALHKQVEKQLIPEDEHVLLDELTALLTERREALATNKATLLEGEAEVLRLEERAEALNAVIRGQTRQRGEVDNELRIQWAKQHSELAAARIRAKRYTEGELPFVLARLPADLGAWSYEDALAARQSESKSGLHLAFLSALMDRVNFGSRKNEVKAAGEALAHEGLWDGDPGPLGAFSEPVLVQLRSRFAEVREAMNEHDGATEVQRGLGRLTALSGTEDELRASTEGVDIVATAEELRAIATELGSKHVEVARLEEEIVALENGVHLVGEQLAAIRSRSDADAPLNRKLSLIDDVVAVVELARAQARSNLAEPLAEEFKAGFTKLSRKSDRVAEVKVDPENYSVHLSMNGFDGNWLDRDLSATERQHTGLSLVYALRRLSNRALPVVVDTPVSRMDREHKEWSVHRFYPELSHQTIVLTTSDDLADGLFDELLEQRGVGLGLEIREVTENRVQIVEADLRSFFGGRS